jgi:hypothetical protein
MNAAHILQLMDIADALRALDATLGWISLWLFCLCFIVAIKRVRPKV